MNSILLISLSILVILILLGSVLIFFYLISQRHHQDKQLKNIAARSVIDFEEAGHVKFQATVLVGDSQEEVTGYYLPKEISYQLHLFSKTLTEGKLNKIPIEIGWQNVHSNTSAKQEFDEFVLRYEVTRDYANYQKIISSADDGEVRFIDDSSAATKGIFSLKNSCLEVFLDNGITRLVIQRVLVKDWREAMEHFLMAAEGLRDKRLPNDLVEDPTLGSEICY